MKLFFKGVGNALSRSIAIIRITPDEIPVKIGPRAGMTVHENPPINPVDVIHGIGDGCDEVNYAQHEHKPLEFQEAFATREAVDIDYKQVTGRADD